MKSFFNLFFQLLALLFTSQLMAFVKPNSLFTNHMVLQQNVVVPVWGTASDGELVTVKFNGQTVSSRAVNGKWHLQLNPLKAGGPFRMEITGENSIMIEDVVVGEVWLCSGQSNMERQLGPRPPQKAIFNWEKERDEARYPQIRMYYVPLKFSAEPLADRDSKWTVCSPETVKQFSAVGYFFAKNLYKNLKVPVGILFSAYGGTDAEHWTSQKDLASNPEFRGVVDNYQKAISNYPEKFEKYKQDEASLLKKFSADSAKAVSENKPLPRKPSAPVHPSNGRVPGGLYNAMINPLLPYAIKGACWYQGESNNDRYQQYASLLTVMISSWRRDFHVGEFPFLIVQIAPFKSMRPEIREAQWEVSKKVKNTALIVTTDCGDSTDIHPAFKQPIGDRLALAARALAYKQEIAFAGPEFKDLKVKGNKMVVTFNHTEEGLWVKGNELRGFTVADASKPFVKAKAIVKKDKVIVSAEGVKHPVAVRFGWENVPDVNLYNKQGLPAVPFRSDK